MRRFILARGFGVGVAVALGGCPALEELIYDSGTPLCTEPCDPLVAGSCLPGFQCGPRTPLPTEQFVCVLDASGNDGLAGDSHGSRRYGSDPRDTGGL